MSKRTHADRNRDRQRTLQRRTARALKAAGLVHIPTQRKGE